PHAVRRPSAHHPRGAPELVGPVLDGALQHRVAPGPPRRSGRSVPAAPPVPRRAGGRRLGRRGPRVPHLPGPVAPPGRRPLAVGRADRLTPRATAAGPIGARSPAPGARPPGTRPPPATAGPEQVGGRVADGPADSG